MLETSPEDIDLPQASMRDVSFDELLDDTIGLSFKSLRSVGTLFKNPLAYYTAAKAPFWENRFSPSFRIYAGFIAVTTGMKFIWRDENSPVVRVYKQQFDMIKAEEVARQTDPTKKLSAENMDTTAMALTTLKWYILIGPVITIISLCLLGLMYQGFGEKLNPIVRIRYIFATMVPASAVGFATILLLYFAPPQFTDLASFLGMAIMFGMFWITSYRGAFPAVATSSGRAGRATALSALMFLFVMISAFIAAVIGIVFAVIEDLSAGVTP